MLTRRRLLESGASALTLLATANYAARARAAAPNIRPQADAKRAAGTANPLPLRELLRQVHSWTYQLQGYDLPQLKASTADVLVVDESVAALPGPHATLTVRDLQQKPDGSRRIVLAYLSIGEAEDYRYYWKSEWIETAEPNTPETDGAPTAPSARNTHADTQATPSTKPDRWPSDKAPPWLGDENESWSGNFAVRFEHPDWQAIFLDGKQSYLARIIAAGFDGVYLDRVDAFYDHAGDLSDPAAAMVAFVNRIAQAARRMKPGFLIVPQNGEELLLRPGYVDLIDAIAKEDLLYGSPTEGKPNSSGQIVNSVGWLGIARRKGHPVLVVEYLDNPAEIANARLELERLGYVATFAPRNLDGISPYAVEPPQAAAGHPP